MREYIGNCAYKKFSVSWYVMLDLKHKTKSEFGIQQERRSGMNSTV